MGERLAPSLRGRRTSRPRMGARPNRAKSPWLIPLTGYGCSSDQPLNHSSIFLPSRPEIGRGLRGPPSSLSLRNCHFACHASTARTQRNTVFNPLIHSPAMKPWCTAPRSPGREVGRSKASCRDLLDPVVQFQPPGGGHRHHSRGRTVSTLQSLGLNVRFYARSSHQSAKPISL